jgi:CubicO group peptidase (beta-lactamase class C family)
MVLKERGLLDLDKPINDYLGDAKITIRVGSAEAATVRRVANHTAGLPLHYQFFYEDEPYRAPARDETIRRYGNAVTPPGERFSYSNLGYGVLDYVISRVSGKSYRDFMRTEVFVPLGLTQVSVDIDTALRQQHAVRYGTDGLPIPFYGFDHPGGSAIYASAHDLIRFATFHLKSHLPDQKPILSDRAIDEMQQPTADVGSGYGYGIGWYTGGYVDGRRDLSHTGGMPGVTTSLHLFPSDKIAITVLINADARPVAKLVMEEIVRVLFPGAVLKPPSQTASTSSGFEPPKELIGRWSGQVHTYKTPVPFALEIRPEGEVYGRLGTQLETVLYRVRLSNGHLTGTMSGDIGTEDASRTPHTLSVMLKLRDGALVGGMTAISLPARRVGNALTHWVELKRE